MLRSQQFPQYIALMRFDKPIGTLLLLWPTLWGLFLASHNMPSSKLLVVFVLGTVLMRAAGCVINDMVDAKFDLQVTRTKERPLATNRVPKRTALILLIHLLLLSGLLVFICNWFTIQLAFMGALFTTIYPFLKRFTHLPQLGLGVAFSWGIPMAFAAQLDAIPIEAWFLFMTAIVWPVIYDTEYAMMDRDDDVKIGVHSTAILFGKQDIKIISYLQILFILGMSLVGFWFSLNILYYFSLTGVMFLFLQQQKWIKRRQKTDYFRAFYNNHWIGLIIFLGIYFGQ